MFYSCFQCILDAKDHVLHAFSKSIARHVIKSVEPARIPGKDPPSSRALQGAKRRENSKRASSSHQHKHGEEKTSACRVIIINLVFAREQKASEQLQSPRPTYTMKTVSQATLKNARGPL